MDGVAPPDPGLPCFRFDTRIKPSSVLFIRDPSREPRSLISWRCSVTIFTRLSFSSFNSFKDFSSLDICSLILLILIIIFNIVVKFDRLLPDSLWPF